MADRDRIPVVDFRSWERGPEGRIEISSAIAAACRQHGFFYVTGHGVDIDLQNRLESLSRSFFARPLDEKLHIAMAHGGRAWRGYFPVGDELTSGIPDRKEGLYFGAELSPDDPRVRASTPMHGANLFPAGQGWRETVLAYLDAMTDLGHRLMRAIAVSLDLDERYFEDRYTADPLILFRIFNYPAASTSHEPAVWGVGEHTDYGLLTILKQDRSGGLEVKTRRGWIEAVPIDNAFVCNIGDMLDRMTSGLYRSTPHRVRNRAAVDRVSFPFFFDPNFSAEVKPIAGLPPAEDDREQRWDQASVHAFEGTYGEYLLAKVSKVFPQLRGALPGESADAG